MSEPANVTKNNNNVIIMVIVGVVVLLLLCMCCFIPFMTLALIGNYDSQNSYKDFPQVSPAEPDSQIREEYNKEYYVGDIVDSGTNTFIVQQYEDPYLPVDGRLLLEGEKLVAVYIDLTNTSQFDTYFSTYDWVMRDEADTTYYSQTFENYKEPLLKSQTLKAGETTSGWVTFAVPKDALSLSFGPSSVYGYYEVTLY